MEAWALSSSPAWGRLCALFVLAPTSKTEELLIASQGPPSFQGDRACSSLAWVRWVGSYTHTHTHTHTHVHTSHSFTGPLPKLALKQKPT